jgi:hypothetical protein
MPSVELEVELASAHPNTRKRPTLSKYPRDAVANHGENGFVSELRGVRLRGSGRQQLMQDIGYRKLP